MTETPLAVIARMHSDFPAKFGIPRQSGLVAALSSVIVFEPAYRNPDCVRGLEDYSHLWLIWGFSAAKGWSPTVRPPRLGGNKRMGVFATRSPFRPNGLGLSSVKLEGVERDNQLGVVLRVSGADLLDDSPIYDVKPYLPYTDCHPEALCSPALRDDSPLTVEISPALQTLVPERHREALLGVLAHDPRPSYQEDPERMYGMTFAGMEVKFTVRNGTLAVQRIEPL